MCVRVAVSLIGAWALMSAFAGAAWSADGWTVYVTNQGGGTATTINTATNATQGTAIVVGASPTGIAITPDGRAAYVANTKQRG